MATTENNSRETTERKKYKKRKYIFLGLGILATSLLSYFGIQYWRKNKKEDTKDTRVPDFEAPKTTFTKKETHTTKSPLKKKPTDTKTKTEQKNKQEPKAETNTHSATNTAPPTPEEPALFQAEKLTEDLRNSILKKDFVKTFLLLKKIRNINDYKYLAEEFNKQSIFGVRRTLVNALLYVFKIDSQRKLLFNSFKSMGLKYQNNKWTLGNLDGTIRLITNQATKVWKTPNEYVNVPINMVLGREVCKRGAFTLFENQQHYYLVESTSIKKY